MAIVYLNTSLCQIERADSIRHASERFTFGKLIVPATMITMGAIGVNNTFLCETKNNFHRTIADLRGDNYTHIDDYAQYVPFATGVALGFAHVPANHSFRERIATTATAALTMGIIVLTIKTAVNERRPDGSETNSFPSGHTATAFTGAEIVRHEYGLGYGIAAYTIVTGVVFLRIYNDRHYLNDVVAGAGIGILSANIAYWLLPLERRLLGWEGDSTSTMVLLPTYEPTHNSFGLAFPLSF
ncbi:MAG: phosphatase PAP2 family protein [Bacteroidales bacterium]|nr:phosphatase PAP2 family protein [Bacteroidales bacterium]